jgi:hypothetical protein
VHSIIHQLLESRVGATFPDDGIVPTKLYAKKKEVLRENLGQR